MLVQKGATLAVHFEMRHTLISNDAFSYSLAKLAREAIVFFKRLLVNIYLPTDTAIIGAFIGSALEFCVVFRKNRFHFILFLRLFFERGR